MKHVLSIPRNFIRHAAIAFFGDPRVPKFGEDLGLPFILFLVIYSFTWIAILIGGVASNGQRSLFQWTLSLMAAGFAACLPFPQSWEKRRGVVRPLAAAAFFSLSIIIGVPEAGNPNAVGVLVQHFLAGFITLRPVAGGGGGGWGADLGGHSDCVMKMKGCYQ